MNKFRFKVSTMLEQVEEDYIKFVGDNYGVNRDEFLKDFKAKLNLESHFISTTVHAELIEYEPNRIIIQTSKYNTIAKEYKDHYLWVFTSNGDKKYDWDLNRFRALPQ